VWCVKYKIKPVINGVHGRVTKGFEKFGNHTGKHSTDSLQQTAALETSHKTSKGLQTEILSLSGGDPRGLKG
jgi:hypothetical protein